jgi:hypothetical protein|eukprot:COSAG02_NODE_3667_length_6400_cov_3.774480_7_plen_70_part_00
MTTLNLKLTTCAGQQILDQIDSPDRGATLLWSKAIAHPGVTEWLRLKAAMCVDLIQDWRAAVVRAEHHR